MADIDHLVYAVPVLDEAIDTFESMTGARPAVGGAHTGLGTHNALISFGNSYLELIAPDPGQPDPQLARPFGIDDLDGPTLVTFAIRPQPDESIEALLDRARTAGFGAGETFAMSRLPPDGAELHWKLSFPTDSMGGTVPFVIDWDVTPNPAHSAPGGIELTDLQVGHPNPEIVTLAYRALGLEMPVAESSTPGVHASFSGPGGVLHV